ncbi:TPA: hypothetical protein CPT80_01435 [Candidatus Gastranaerophilales bacterium HUM_9]|nr:MAG TPA: hypothetical protein CPT80_01435 [Candidatus Gastranaerophilales bacterium HUM_9]
MIFFIATIFIAQVIIVWNIVFFIISLDNKVIALSNDIESYSEILPDLIQTIREMTSDINTMLPEIYKSFVKKRNELVLNELKSILESLAIVLLKPQYKKMFVGLKLVTKLTKKLIKLKNML